MDLDQLLLLFAQERKSVKHFLLFSSAYFAKKKLLAAVRVHIMVYAFSYAFVIAKTFDRLQHRSTSQLRFRSRLPWWPHLTNIHKNGLRPPWQALPICLSVILFSFLPDLLPFLHSHK